MTYPLIFAGDWHANLEGPIHAIGFAAKHGAKTIFQVGDFGYWPNSSLGRKFLVDTVAALREWDMQVFFVDGNHEDHMALRSWEDDLGASEINHHIHHIRRGTLVGGMFGMGGAVSIDRKWRKLDVTWFREEVPSEEQFQTAMLTLPHKVEVVLAHEGLPQEPLQGLDVKSPMWAPAANEFALAETIRQKMFGYIAARLQPKLWVHGHWHERLTTQIEWPNGNTTRVEALDMTPRPGSLIAVDPFTFETIDEQ